MSENVFVYDSTSPNGQKVYKTLEEFSVHNPAKPLKSIKPGSFNKHTPMPFEEEAIAMLLLLIWPGCLLWIWFPLIWIIQNLIFNLTSVTAWILFTLLLYLSFAPVRYWKGGVDSWVNNLAIKYFSFRAIWEETLQPEKQAYILVAPPHGVFPFGNILTLTFLHTYTGFHFRGAGASVLYSIPIMRHVMSWMGNIDAGWSTMKKTLSEGKSVGLSTGGIAELFESSTDTEVIIIKNRKGFVRMALATGASLVPCYLFGNTHALKCLSGKRLQEFSRRIKASITFFWGRWGLPIAYRTPILGVMGKPIHLPKIEGTPDPKFVDKIHEEFIEAIVELFDKYKGVYGWADKKLIVK